MNIQAEQLLNRNNNKKIRKNEEEIKFPGSFPHDGTRRILMFTKFKEVLHYCVSSQEHYKDVCDELFWKEYILKNIDTGWLSYEDVLQAKQMSRNQNLLLAIESTKAEIISAAEESLFHAQNIRQARTILMELKSNTDTVLKKLFTMLKNSNSSYKDKSEVLEVLQTISQQIHEDLVTENFKYYTCKQDFTINEKLISTRLY